MSIETELLEKSKSGDEGAFITLIDNTLNKIKPAIFNSYSNLNYDDFQDALQIATVKAWQKLSTFRGDSAFSTWFFIILKNEILNSLNTRNQIRKFEISTEELGLNKDTDTQFDYDNVLPKNVLDEAVSDTAQTILEKQDDLKIYREMLSKVLDKLKPSHSQIIKLVFDEGKSYKEASDELNIPIGTVMSRLFFARKNAQKLIKQYAQRNNIQLPQMGKREELAVS